MKVLNTLDLTGQRIINLADPSTSTDAVTKQYVDNAIAGLAWKDSVHAASTTNGTLATAFEPGDTLDGVVLAEGDRLLLKNQTDATENGIYVVQASGAPVRTYDADSGSDLVAAAVYVEAGSVNENSAWVCNTSSPIVLGLSLITFARYSADQPYFAGSGLSLSDFTFDVVANGDSIDVGSSGIKLAQAAGGAGVTVDTSGHIAVGAGLGISVDTDTVAIDTSVVVRKVSASVGNGTATNIAVNHNLGTKDVVVTVRENATDEAVWVDWTATTTNSLTLSFAVAPSTNAYRVTIHG